MGERGEATSELLVIFGITGDLARKMTFRALYRLERRKLLDCPILGVASDDITIDELLDRAAEAIRKTGEPFDEAVFDRLAKRMSYLHGDVTDAALYEQLAERVGADKQCLYYLE
ncbi:MAG: glucose-6-phosphate dehydrogenase, partial [Mycolicibacter sinensis]